MFARLLALFLIVPIIEIVLFMTIGRTIGWPVTIGMIIITGVLGASLTRSQGIQTIARFQSKLAQGQIPGEEVASGLLILVAGAVLLTPGFLTDVIGFSLLVPGFRKWLGGKIAKKYAGKVVGATVPSNGRDPGIDSGGGASQEGRVIDVEAEIQK